MSDFLKRYIKISKEFRANKSHENIAKLYDLKEELEQVNRTKQDDLTLSNVYVLLGFHQSAFDIFKSIVDLSKVKQKSKLYVLEEKAKSHGNNFILKDIRVLKVKPKKITISEVSFEKLENTYKLNINPIIFGKTIAKEKVNFSIGNHQFEDYVQRIIKYLEFLSDCKTEIITYFNSELSDDLYVTANEDWYYLLDTAYRVLITIGIDRNLYAEIATGHDSIDHILDIKFKEKSIIDMQIDG